MNGLILCILKTCLCFYLSTFKIKEFINCITKIVVRAKFW